MVSFGFAGQGRAIMRGPMVSGVINQLLTTTDWYAKEILDIFMKASDEHNKAAHFYQLSLS
jgi:Mrp family chromosome partitioning ATPase